MKWSSQIALHLRRTAASSTLAVHLQSSCARPRPIQLVRAKNEMRRCNCICDLLDYAIRRIYRGRLHALLSVRSLERQRVIFATEVMVMFPTEVMFLTESDVPKHNKGIHPTYIPFRSNIAVAFAPNTSQHQTIFNPRSTSKSVDMASYHEIMTSYQSLTRSRASQLLYFGAILLSIIEFSSYMTMCWIAPCWY